MNAENNNENDLQSALSGGGTGGDAPVDETADSGDAGFINEEKKPFNRTSLVMFGILALGGAGLYLMHLRTGPASASASAEAVSAKETINTFLSDSQNMQSMQAMLKDTEKVVKQFLSYPGTPQVPLSNLKTNPFRQTDGKPKDDTEADAKRRREEERLAIMKAADDLQLQSIMHSSARKACMINNTMYSEGQIVEGFTIEKIAAGSVTLKNGEYHIERKMKR